jgi:hypothetical protein
VDGFEQSAILAARFQRTLVECPPVDEDYNLKWRRRVPLTATARAYSDED